MRSRFCMSLIVLLAGALLPSGPALAADANVIRGVDVDQRDGAVELVIRGSRAPSYSVFKLQEPQRLVVDLAGADVTGIASRDVKKGGVLSVSTAQYSDARARVGRVIVNLDGPQRYEVVPRGDDVVVRVLQGNVEPTAAARGELAQATPPQSVSEPRTASRGNGGSARGGTRSGSVAISAASRAFHDESNVAEGAVPIRPGC